jgi:hypothetical protein
MQAPPPRSLQELLERQWEQTAQFILDQAGKQNNGEGLVVSSEQGEQQPGEWVGSVGSRVNSSLGSGWGVWAAG